MATTWEPPPTLYQQLDAASLVFGTATVQSDATKPPAEAPGGDGSPAGGAAAMSSWQPAGTASGAREGGDAFQLASEGADGPPGPRGDGEAEDRAAAAGSPAVVKSSRCDAVLRCCCSERRQLDYARGCYNDVHVAVISMCVHSVNIIVGNAKAPAF